MPPPTVLLLPTALHITPPPFHLKGMRAACTALHTPWLQHPEGGFGGGPYQLAHLAPTYAAVSALVTLGGADALSGTGRLPQSV
jgi:hypothetical protein